MPTDLEAMEAEEAAGLDRRPTPRGRILVFCILAFVFVLLAVLSTLRRDRPERDSWVEHAPGVAYYRIDQPHLSGALFDISQNFEDLHNDLCHQLEFSTTGGAMFRARSIFVGIGRSHFAKIPGGLGGANQFTIFASYSGKESAVAMVTGIPKRKPTHLLIIEHEVNSRQPHHTFPLRSIDDHIYPPIRSSFAPGAYLSGAAVPTGDSFTNVVNFYETKFRPSRLGTAKASTFRIPPADPSQTNVYTIFIQSSRGPKFIHVVDDGGMGHLSIVSFNR